MTTVVNLTMEEMAEIKALTDQSDAEEAVRAAIAEYLRYARRQRLKALSGKVEMQENWREMEAAEVRAADEVTRSRPD